jgi:hypothetical protein
MQFMSWYCSVHIEHVYLVMYIHVSRTCSSYYSVHVQLKYAVLGSLSEHLVTVHISHTTTACLKQYYVYYYTYTGVLQLVQ